MAHLQNNSIELGFYAFKLFFFRSLSAGAKNYDVCVDGKQSFLCSCFSACKIAIAEIVIISHYWPENGNEKAA
jgi:hypothetical protein